MTAPRITAEEIAELRTQPHDNHTLVRRILDALESAYARECNLHKLAVARAEAAENYAGELSWPDDDAATSR